MSANWKITITDFLGGMAPGYFKNTYPSYGSKNQAGSMLNCCILDPTGVTQGPGLANLTNGTQANAVTTLISRIMNRAVSTDVTYAVGGAKLYKLSSSAVTSDGTWPHTIDKPGVTGESGSDVIDYQGNLYYSYNYTSVVNGDIGKYNLDATFDDDWGSQVPTGKSTLVGGVPHKFIIGGSDYLYITNGNKMAQYIGDTTTLSPAKLTLPTGHVISSAEWTADSFFIASNPSSLTGSNKADGQISIWDGSSILLDDIIIGLGRLGATFLKNGIVFVFHQDITSTGGYALGYVNGDTVKDIAFFSGSLPSFEQVAEYNGLIIWVSGDDIYAWGSVDSTVPVALSQLMSGGYTTVGGISTVFGDILTASTQSTSYKLAKSSGYETSSNWKSIMFDVSQSSDQGKSAIDKIVINTNTLSTGARVDLTITADNGATTWTDDHSATDSPLYQHIFNPKHQCSNFRIEFAFDNGSTTNNVIVKSCEIYGHTI